MESIEPWAASSVDQGEVEKQLASLLGRSFLSWDFLYPDGFGDHRPLHYEGFDLAEMEVELAEPNGSSVLFSWQMRGVHEGLAIKFGPPSVGLKPGEPERRERGSDALPCNVPITEVAVAWQELDHPSDTALWSVRLAFEGGQAVTLALGEPSDSGSTLQYIPDSIVVIFDQQVAKAYRPPASRESAWGRVIIGS